MIKTRKKEFGKLEDKFINLQHLKSVEKNKNKNSKFQSKDHEEFFLEEFQFREPLEMHMQNWYLKAEIQVALLLFLILQDLELHNNVILLLSEVTFVIQVMEFLIN